MQIKLLTVFILLILSLLAGAICFLIIKFLITNKTRKGVRIDRQDVLPFTLGFFEILMFSFSILVNTPSFIAFWISVKTALKWNSRPIIKKKKDTNRQLENKENKFTYLRFLIGNAINIILSYVIASIIKGEVIIFRE